MNIKDLRMRGGKYILSRIPTIPFRIKKIWYIRYNRFIFWLNDVKFGKNMMVCNKFYLQKLMGSQIVIGDNFKFTSGDGQNPLSRSQHGCIHAGVGAKIVIGNNVGISSSSIRAGESITIGNNVKIGGDCIIMDTDAHSMDWRLRTSKERTADGRSIDNASAKTKPIVICDDVLLGMKSIILKGVTIGARSVIGSGSVVTKNVPEDEIWAGNPARFIRKVKSEK